MKKLKISRQYYVYQHLFTKFFGWLANRRWKWWKNWQIRYFIKRYQVDLSCALNEDIESYPTFNHFFTRHLKPEARPIVHGENELACPVDGFVSQIGDIRKDLLLQAKGFDFQLDALLASKKWASLFE